MKNSYPVLESSQMVDKPSSDMAGMIGEIVNSFEHTDFGHHLAVQHELKEVAILLLGTDLDRDGVVDFFDEGLPALGSAFEKAITNRIGDVLGITGTAVRDIYAFGSFASDEPDYEKRVNQAKRKLYESLKDEFE